VAAEMQVDGTVIFAKEGHIILAKFFQQRISQLKFISPDFPSTKIEACLTEKLPTLVILSWYHTFETIRRKKQNPVFPLLCCEPSKAG
jgi:hypothetical protein